jgi:hypothetical protein
LKVLTEEGAALAEGFVEQGLCVIDATIDPSVLVRKKEREAGKE